MPDLSVKETAATQSTNDSEVGPGEEAIVVEGASVDAEGTSVFEGISVVAEETSLVAATSVRVAVVLSSIVGHRLIEPLTSLIQHPTRPHFAEKSQFATLRPKCKPANSYGQSRGRDATQRGVREQRSEFIQLLLRRFFHPVSRSDGIGSLLLLL